MLKYFVVGLLFLHTTVAAQQLINFGDLGWMRECDKQNMTTEKNKLIVQHFSSDERPRCEVANRTWLSLGSEFEVAFDIAVNSNYHENYWHNIMQIHSFPDLEEGEVWRCPILSVEVKGGMLRAFSRFDKERISQTINGSCANEGNSIRSNKLFDRVPFKSNANYRIEVAGKLSTGQDGFLKISINDEVVSFTKGPNAFNDVKGPYLKLGIYKPSGWLKPGQLSYTYSNLVVE